ncbi:hypothetical protein BJ875DRAFT_174268 [Amylocarpus encephaloides]|uniref:Uncharacterized protein n=1 Tax=Amylocarpus encephaloides TaxID=45428 RepID=A0A9P7YA64_9HELO|nr:hypothetical protein BJ875DRAFT_174268 [Amylocarpus encephaloides]
MRYTSLSFMIYDQPPGHANNHPISKRATHPYEVTVIQRLILQPPELSALVDIHHPPRFHQQVSSSQLLRTIETSFEATTAVRIRSTDLPHIPVRFYRSAQPDPSAAACNSSSISTSAHTRFPRPSSATTYSHGTLHQCESFWARLVVNSSVRARRPWRASNCVWYFEARSRPRTRLRIGPVHNYTFIVKSEISSHASYEHEHEKASSAWLIANDARRPTTSDMLCTCPEANVKFGISPL